MATNRFLTIVNGIKTLVQAVSSFTGNANEIVATDGSGKISSDLLPAGLEIPEITATASEDIAAGDWVHYFDNAGTVTVEKADASDQTKVCNGFCLTAILTGNTGTVSLEGINTGVTVAAAGVGEPFFLTDTAGVGSLTPVAITDDYINQNLGFVTGVNACRFDPSNYEFIDIA